jgi:glycerophosphoryl diester phosphodiesterase
MKKIIYLFFAVLVLGACTKEKLDVNNLREGRIMACGHGGSGFQSYTNPYPSNSFSSITRALEGLGADAVEVDVQMSADKKLILFHNETLESATACSGCIPSLQSQEILGCSYNRDFGVSQFSEEHLILLETILQRYSSWSPRPVIFLDIRDNNPCDAAATPNEDTLANEIAKMINKYNGTGWLYVIADDAVLLNKIRSGAPGVRVYLDTEDASAGIAEAIAQKLNGIVIVNEWITAQQVQGAHEKNIEVVLFGIKTREGTLEAVRKSPDAIQTDNLELLLEVLRD